MSAINLYERRESWLSQLHDLYAVSDWPLRAAIAWQIAETREELGVEVTP